MLSHNSKPIKSYLHVKIPSNIFWIPAKDLEKSKLPDQLNEKVSSKLFCEFSLLPLEDDARNDEWILFASRSEYTDITHININVITVRYLILAILKKLSK